MKFCTLFWHRWRSISVNRYFIPMIEECKCCGLKRGIGVQKILNEESKLVYEYFK